MDLEQLEAEILKLTRSQRARLAQALLSSLDEDAEVDDAWEAEAEQRYRRYLAGEEEALPASEVLAELRSERGR